MSGAFARYAEQMTTRHAAEVVDGKHDVQCEFGTYRESANPWEKGATRVTQVWMCHCSKRRREAEGYTEPPGPVVQQMPLCPRCHREVDWDDGFRCDACCAYWSDTTPEAPAAFMDEYGDLGTYVPAPGGAS